MSTPMQTPKSTDESRSTDEIQRDPETGKFLPGTTPKNAFESGQQPDNRCPKCGQGRSKETETDEYIRWYCNRCDETFTEATWRGAGY